MKLGSFSKKIKQNNALFCTNCGTKLTVEGKFCYNCGVPIESVEVKSKDNINFECYESMYHNDAVCSFSMEFYDEEQTGDRETARKVFEYCLETFDWFMEEDNIDKSVDEYGIFELNEYIISSCEDLKLKLSEKWISYIFNKFKPKSMHVVNVEDNSSEGYAENYVKIYEVVDGKLTRVLSGQFAKGDYFDFFVDSSSGCPFRKDSYKKLYPVFKSKLTGKIYHTQNCLEVKSAIENDYYDRWIRNVANDKYKLYFDGALALNEDGTPAKILSNIKKFDFSSFFDEPYYIWEEEPEGEDSNEGDDNPWDIFEFVELEERYN